MLQSGSCQKYYVSDLLPTPSLGVLQSKAKFFISYWSALFFSLGKMRLHPRGEEELGKGLCNPFWGFPWPTLSCPLPTMRLHPGPAPPSQNRLVEPEGRNKERVGDQDLRCVESNLHLSWLGYLWWLWQTGRSRIWWQSPSLGKSDMLVLISAVCQLCVTGKFNFSNFSRHTEEGESYACSAWF